MHATALPIHPRSGLRALGFRRNGAPIWPIMGASEDHDGDTTGGDADTSTTEDATDSGTDADTKGADKTPTIDGDLDKERHAKALAASRAAEKKAKERAQVAEKARADAEAAAQKAIEDMKKNVLKQFGIGEDEQVDPAELAKRAAAERDQLAKERDDAIAQLAAKEAENAVVRRGAKANADVDELLDSDRFRKQLGQLEPAADDFTDRLDELIKKFVTDNPKRYALAPVKQPPGKAGADITGSGGGANKRAGSLGEALRNAYAGR